MRTIFFILLLLVNSAHAEIYRDFVPNTTIAKIKQNYPNAKIEIMNVAWVQPHERFIKITGQGLPGTIFVLTEKRTDEQVNKEIETLKKWLEEGSDSSKKTYELLINYDERYLNAEDDEKYLINWLRWIPDSPFPLERLISKYGNPTKFDFNEENFVPYAFWDTGINASLSDDKKMVNFITYFVTSRDYDIANGVASEGDDKKVIKDHSKTPKKPTNKKSSRYRLVE